MKNIILFLAFLLPLSLIGQINFNTLPSATVVTPTTPFPTVNSGGNWRKVSADLMRAFIMPRPVTRVSPTNRYVLGYVNASDSLQYIPGGLMSQLPLGSVTISAATNSLTLSGLGGLNFNTTSWGSGWVNRLALTRSGSSTLSLLKGGQTISISADTLTGASMRWNNIGFRAKSDSMFITPESLDSITVGEALIVATKFSDKAYIKSKSVSVSGTAGGDLTGTYPNPTIGNNKVISAYVLDGTLVNADFASQTIDSNKVKNGAITPIKINKTGATGGQVLKYNSSTGNVEWARDSSVYTTNGRIATTRTINFGSGATNNNFGSTVYTVGLNQSSPEWSSFMRSPNTLNSTTFDQRNSNSLTYIGLIGNTKNRTANPIRYDNYFSGDNSTTSLVGFSATLLAKSNNQTGAVQVIDSTKNRYGSFLYSTFNATQKNSIVGLVKGGFGIGNTYTKSLKSSFVVQTSFTDTTNLFNWIKIDDIENDTTSNRISFYNGKYVFPNSAPGSGNKIIEWQSGVPVWISTPSGGGSGITALTGDVTASGTGSVAATIAANAVTSAKVASQTLDSTDLKNRGTTLLKLAQSGATNGQVPKYNSTTGNWEPAADNSTGGSTITEKRIYYRNEVYKNMLINTSTGLLSTDSTKDVTDLLPVNPSESITIYTANASNVTIYGWFYNASRQPISEIRSSSLISTPLNSYTVTTPSNTKYICIYVRYNNGVDFSALLKIESTSNYTYNIPITPENYTGTTSSRIQQALDFARFTTSAVELKGLYLIDSTIILHSGNTLILNNARVRMNTGMRTNMVRNESVKSQDSIFSRGNVNIKIIGIGNAIFEGNDDNWGSDNPTGVGSKRWSSIGILFANVQRFDVTGIMIKNTKAWSMCFEQCQIGSITNITFEQNKAQANQDGINIRRGSNRITIENVKGYTYDDMIALTNIEAAPTINILGARSYMPTNPKKEIRDIIIKNIQRKAVGVFPANILYYGGILLLCADSLKIHNITIDGVTGIAQINVGFLGYALASEATVNDLYNINISNTNKAPIYINQPIKNSSFTNIARIDSTGSFASGVFPSGSYNNFRKYQDGYPEFFDSNNNRAISEINSTTFEDFSLTNSNASGTIGLKVKNNLGNYAYLRAYGSTATPSTLQNKMLFGASSGDLIISSNVSVSPPTSSRIILNANSYTTSNSAMAIFGSTNNVSIGNTIDNGYKLDVTGSTRTSGNFVITSTNSNDLSSVTITNDASTNAFFRVYGSTASLSHLSNRAGFGTTSDLLLFTDSNSGSGGSKAVKIYAGGYNADQERIHITKEGVRINSQSNATAALHLPAVTATAGTAPLKFTSGTNLTTPEAGAVEYDGTEFYATNSGASRTILARVLKGSATLDFGSTAAGAVTDLTITVTGAADGDVVSLSVQNASQTATGSFSAWVSAANTVTVRYRIAALTGSEDPASGTFKVTVTK